MPMNVSMSTGWRRASLVRSAALRSGLSTMAWICARLSGAPGLVTVEELVEDVVVVIGIMTGGLPLAQPSRAAAASAAGTQRRRAFLFMACLVVRGRGAGDVARPGVFRARVRPHWPVGRHRRFRCATKA